MKKFRKSIRGYKVDDVNSFVSEVVSHVEDMLNEIREKDDEILRLKNDIEKYQNMEKTLNKSILMEQETSDQMRKMARIEAENIIGDAKKNANKIVSTALDKATKIESDANIIKKNISVYKSRIKNIIEQQLEIIDDIDNIKM